MTLRENVYRTTHALQRRIVPELKYSQAHYEEELWRYAPGAQSWLDIGCGHHLLPVWRSAAEEKLLATVPLVVGIDRDYDALRKHSTIRNVLQADIGMLPFQEQSFDLVTANMVIEHLDDPLHQFREIARVLRPGGIFLFHTPNLRSYVIQIARRLPDGLKKALARALEGRKEEDVYPTHYRANTANDIRAVADHAGLDVMAIKFTVSTPVFSLVPPLAAVELFYLRQLARRPKLASYGQTLICALRRPAE
ncbi:MAG TPA: class I SAM-dependent methyltransferase [Microvirga sp.]|nr:class I SAM-dependent methyltransferase [Microvirga sp.]